MHHVALAERGARVAGPVGHQHALALPGVAEPRSSFQDYALVLFFAAIVLIAMGGWVYFLGGIALRLAIWLGVLALALL